MLETWKDVIGFESFYQVSSHGNIRRIAPWCDGRKTKPGQLSVKPKKSGYVRVNLRKNNVLKQFAVHRLVMAAFIGALPSPRHQVNHRNGIRSDNRVENLEYLLPSDNQLHAFHVLMRKPNQRGSKHHQAKLSEEIAAQIIERYSAGELQKSLALEFKVSRPTISEVCTRKSWKHI